jgi:multiple antibiotic resistance protein
VMASKAHGIPQKAIFYGLIALVALISYFVLTVAADGAKRLSPTFLNIVTRLMGLLLAAIGVQLILTALKLG